MKAKTLREKQKRRESKRIYELVEEREQISELEIFEFGTEIEEFRRAFNVVPYSSDFWSLARFPRQNLGEISCWFFCV